MADRPDSSTTAPIAEHFAAGLPAGERIRRLLDANPLHMDRPGVLAD
ncbi:MAG TPA: hypothetical protein VG186_07230 [Solirubrobacteraceae bacterium]|nr:hypothetical protein [Solirubrobacteraceae bacterium]